ncbi:hypothetical protein FEE95_00935 [Maribacter algarum]|uniref:Lipocalin-like domain-containing protein n=1 Tax=Maribacter algarum (ex Zhang et al. 2020) TaxID=2578118 RepID=A0A5S3PV04_9FLAO|nr:hypothetical protein [Maribacter algarum]TMM58022.1 hypothetical protein FEE95_00935 [Maribacter algarum]
MKTKNYKTLLIICCTILIVGCSSDPGGGTTFIPGFNATWQVEGDSDYKIDLQPNDDNKNVHMGVFDGDEIHNSKSELNNPLSGSFKGLEIEFTINREDPGPDVQYKGTMTPVSETDHTIVRIELSSSEGDLVLVSL